MSRSSTRSTGGAGTLLSSEGRTIPFGVSRHLRRAIAMATSESRRSSRPARDCIRAARPSEAPPTALAQRHERHRAVRVSAAIAMTVVLARRCGPVATSGHGLPVIRTGGLSFGAGRSALPIQMPGLGAPRRQPSRPRPRVRGRHDLGSAPPLLRPWQLRRPAPMDRPLRSARRGLRLRPGRRRDPIGALAPAARRAAQPQARRRIDPVTHGLLIELESVCDLGDGQILIWHRLNLTESNGRPVTNQRRTLNS